MAGKRAMVCSPLVAALFVGGILLGLGGPCGCVRQPGPAASGDAAAMGSGRVLHVADADFRREILENPKLVLLDVWAPWCEPCLKLSDILEELATTYEGRVVFAKLNMDENPRTVKEYEIDGVPTLLFFRSGRVIERIEGLGPKSELVTTLESFLKR